MKHVPRIEKDEVEPATAEAWNSTSFDLAIFHINAHAENVFAKWRLFNRSAWEQEPDEMPKVLKEMAVVHASVLSDSPYEWANHGSQMLLEGATQEQLDALVVERNPKSDLFDATEQLVLQFADEIVRDARPTEATLTALSKQFTNKDIIKLLYLICIYMMNSRMANIGGLEEGDDEDYGMFHLGRKTKDAE